MKLSLDALKEKAEAVVTEELLSEITGGVKDDCHKDIDASRDLDGVRC